MKTNFAIAICTVFIAALLWNAAASAHHRGWHKGGGGGFKQKLKGGGAKIRRGGGPPPWAPAHGYRAKYRYMQGGQVREAAPQDLVRVPDSGVGSCNRETLGMVLGGGLGAAAGTQIGSGSGKIAATIAGTIIGALIGGSAGRSMDRIDQNCVGQALEQAPDGRAVAWRNPDQGGQYQVTPTRTYQTSSGQYCREYQTTITIAGRAENAYGTACRQADGSWKKTRY